MRLRSIVAVPSGESPSAEFLESSADALLFVLSDARISIDHARDSAVAGIRLAREAGKAVLVQINHARTGLLDADLEAVVPSTPGGVLLTGAWNPQDVRDAAVALRRVELQFQLEPGCVALFPVIDTARGLLRTVEIVEAAPRVAGLVFDGDAYALDVGGRPEENGPRLAYARGSVVAACRGNDRQPLVVSSGLELRFLAQHGFAGAIINEARYIPPANQVFTPGVSAVKRAQRHLDAYQAARAEGALVARVETEVADAHSARKAQQTLEATDH